MQSIIFLRLFLPISEIYFKMLLLHRAVSIRIYFLIQLP